MVGALGKDGLPLALDHLETDVLDIVKHCIHF
jgi:hypothetical protein